MNTAGTPPAPLVLSFRDTQNATQDYFKNFSKKATSIFSSKSGTTVQQDGGLIKWQRSTRAPEGRPLKRTKALGTGLPLKRHKAASKEPSLKRHKAVSKEPQLRQQKATSEGSPVNQQTKANRQVEEQRPSNEDPLQKQCQANKGFSHPPPKKKKPFFHNSDRGGGGGKGEEETRKPEDRGAAPAPTTGPSDEATETARGNYDVVTSLFVGNPDIPQLPCPTVARATEKVFSHDSFSNLSIAPQIVSNMERLGLTTMTMVQQRSLPHILAGNDTLVKSQTGSGKTLAYALPIVHALMKREPRVQRTDGVLALVVVPTRELALQSYQWFEKLCKSCVWVVPGLLVGGEKKKAEKARVRKGLNILVGTPGRIIDHLHHTQTFSMARVQFLVLDEADRLLEMGYERSITSIIESLNEQQPGPGKKRQTIMLSATLTAGVEKLAGMSLESPEVVDVSSNGSEGSGEVLALDTLATPENLTHYYMLVPAKLRLVSLAAFILAKCKFGNERKMIIFMATQDMVDYHTALFSALLARYGEQPQRLTSLQRRAERVLAGGEDHGEGEEDEEDIEEDEEEELGTTGERKDIILFQKLHGNMTQQDRSAVFNSFREATAGVLLCTDVGSRGLDLPRVDWSVQYTAAGSAADYVHRAGRTARVEAPGASLVFLTPAEAPYVQHLLQHKIPMKETLMRNTLQQLRVSSDQSKAKTLRGSVEEGATSLQVQVEKLLLADGALHDLARKAYVSFVRSYASYPREVREMFNFRQLHLGHYAKSMGLRDTPGALGASQAFRAKQEIKEKRERKELKRSLAVRRQRSGQLSRTAAMSEFDSGLDTLPRPAKKKSKK